MTQTNSSVLALDVGDRRIGVAIAHLTSRLPEPWGVIARDDSSIEAIKALAAEQHAIALVVGLPRGMEGQETAQTRQVRQFVNELKKTLRLPIYMQDEALTSIKAEEELRNKGIRYTKEAVDELAATYILTDFLGEHRELSDGDK